MSAILAVSGMCLAAVPATLTQQGRLIDSDGEPVGGSVTIAFTLYDEAEDGTVLWTETHDVTLDEGYFSVQLGSETPFEGDDFEGSTRYLGVKVGSDDEMVPRQAVTSVPYAFNASFSDLAGTVQTVDWDVLTGFPSPCAAGQFLRGFDASGNAVCAASPTQSCTYRYTNSSSSTSVSTFCSAGEVLTGGGCTTTTSIRSSTPTRACSTLCILCLVTSNGTGTCGADGWYCSSGSAASITAWASCCTVD